jgi:D-sedoheptulose 7-phosphate isomerase
MEIFSETAGIREKFLRDNLTILEDVIRTLTEIIGQENKILFFGNGGSAADAQHIAAEFVNRYKIDRRPLPALALTTDTSVLTAIANDFGYENLFEKQVKALGKKGDAVVGISTSGNSVNVNKGLQAAKEIGLVTVGLGGPSSCPMRDQCDYYLSVEGGSTPRIQEVQHIIGHIIVELLEESLFGEGKLSTRA